MPDYTPDETINGTFVTNSPQRAIYRFVVRNGVIVEADWVAENSLTVAREIGGWSWWLPGKYLGWHVRWSVHSPSHDCAVARFRAGITGGEVDILEGMEYLYPVESEG